VDKLIVLGLGADQISSLFKARSLGFYLVGLDFNPQAKGVAYVDEFYPVSIKHLSQVENFLKQVTLSDVVGVIAFGVDIPSIVARVADHYAVNYTVPYASAKLSEDKHLSKQLMLELGIPIPAFLGATESEIAQELEMKLGYPLVVKPVDNSAARGISLVQSSAELQQALDVALEHSVQKKLIVETYLSGPQISSESLVVEGQVVHVGFADRNYAGMERFLPNIIEDGGDLPSSFMTEALQTQLTDYWEKLAERLAIKNGIIKGDLVIHQGKLYVIEFALRMSGGHFASTEIPACYGIDYIAACIRLHAGQSLSLPVLRAQSLNAVSLRYQFIEDVSSCAGKRVNSWVKPQTDKRLLMSECYFEKGQILPRKTESHAQRIACVMALGDDRESAIALAQQSIKNMELVCE
jgi:biotin carboxylase